MKQKRLFQPILAILLLAVLVSCKKDEYTIEDKAVTGSMNYVRTAFDVTEADPVTQQPLKATIGMEATCTFSDLGELTQVSTFTFDFVAGQGSNFITT
jgi:hypothetical protein